MPTVHLNRVALTGNVVLVLALATLASGCSAMSGAGANVAYSSGASNSLAPRGATGESGGGPLPASDADPDAIQPQPPPGSCHTRGSGLFSLPDPRCTPGAIDPAVTQANITETICHPGYTSAIRPPESVTEPEKRASLAAYGEEGPLGDYEYDHLVPLELGGAKNDPRNLWPEPGASPNPKDALEDRLNSLVCAGRLGLATARREIASDWIAAYHRYGL